MVDPKLRLWNPSFEPVHRVTGVLSTGARRAMHSRHPERLEDVVTADTAPRRGGGEGRRAQTNKLERSRLFSRVADFKEVGCCRLQCGCSRGANFATNSKSFVHHRRMSSCGIAADSSTEHCGIRTDSFLTSLLSATDRNERSAQTLLMVNALLRTLIHVSTR